MTVFITSLTIYNFKKVQSKLTSSVCVCVCPQRPQISQTRLDTSHLQVSARDNAFGGQRVVTWRDVSHAALSSSIHSAKRHGGGLPPTDLWHSVTVLSATSLHASHTTAKRNTHSLTTRRLAAVLGSRGPRKLKKNQEIFRQTRLTNYRWFTDWFIQPSINLLMYLKK